MFFIPQLVDVFPFVISGVVRRWQISQDTGRFLRWLLSFIGKLSALVGTVPLAVTGGLAIYLFGVIGMQGIAIIQSEKVNLFDPRQLAVGAVVTIVAIGGQIMGGYIPVVVPGIFPDGLPCIATGAVAGIFLNLIFLLLPVEMFGVVIPEAE